MPNFPLLVFWAVIAFCAVTVAQTSCQTLYGFEDGISGWYIDSSSNAAGVYSSNQFVTEGAKSLQLDFNPGPKAIYKVEGPLNVQGYRYLVVDLGNGGGLSTVGFVVESDTWTESSPQTIASGGKSYVFDLWATTWKSANSGWAYSQRVNQIDNIRRIAIMLYDTQYGDAYIDNVKKCLDGTAASATPTRAPVSATGTPTRPAASATGTPTRVASATATRTRSVTASGTPTRPAVSATGTPTRVASATATRTRPVTASGTPTRPLASATRTPASISASATRTPASASATRPASASSTRAPASPSRTPSTTASTSSTNSRTRTPSSTKSVVVVNTARGFARACGTAFCIDECKYYFSGTNLYYLVYQNNDVVERALDSAKSMGALVVRTWAFLDAGYLKGYDYNGYWFQKTNSNNYGDPIYNNGTDPRGLRHLDDVLYRASQRGMKLILTLTNNWRAFGGADQYVQWWGMDKHDYFFTDARVKNTFKNYIHLLANRVNYNTGIKYKDDPTIFAWELINEPRCSASGDLYGGSGYCNSQTITNWVNEMSTYLRGQDNNHMIALGDEGFFNRPGNSDWTYNGGAAEGGNFDANLALTNIDFGTFHVYADQWGKDASTWVNQWIIDHGASAVAANKPVILEEYGYGDAGRRVNLYTSWTNTVESNNIAASLFWMLGVSGSPGDEYIVYYPDSATNVIRDHGLDMANKNTCVRP